MYMKEDLYSNQMNNEIEVDNLKIKYTYTKHEGDLEWEDFALEWVRNSQTLEYLDKRSLSDGQWKSIMMRILEDVYGDRQSKEREHVSVSDADRVLTGDSGTVYPGDSEESFDNSYPNEEG